MPRKFLVVVLGCLLVVDLYPLVEGLVWLEISAAKALYEIMFLGLYFATAYFWGRGNRGKLEEDLKQTGAAAQVFKKMAESYKAKLAKAKKRGKGDVR